MKSSRKKFFKSMAVGAGAALSYPLVFSNYVSKDIVNLHSDENARSNLSVCNALDFGAIGDGETNSAQKIQNALDSLSTGGIVFVPAGTYLLERTVLIPHGCCIIGEGRSTVFKSNFPVGVGVNPLIISNAGVTTAEGYNAAGNIVMGNFAIDSPQSNGIGCSHCDGAIFYNIYGLDTHWHSFDIAGSKNVIIKDFYLTTNGRQSILQIDNMVDNISGYFVYDGNTSVNSNNDGTVSRDILIKDGFIEGNNANWCIHFHRSGGRGITIDNVKTNGAEYSLYQDEKTEWSDITISNCTFRNNYKSLSVKGNSVDERNKVLKIVNCNFQDFRNQGVVIYDWDNITIDNCYFDGLFSEGNTEDQVNLSLYNSDNIIIDKITNSGSVKSNKGIRMINSNASDKLLITNSIIKNTLCGLVIETGKITFAGLVFVDCETNIVGSGDSISPYLTS